MGGGDAAAREAEARERDLATEETERLRWVVRRQHKELRARIAEVACKEAGCVCWASAPVVAQPSRPSRSPATASSWPASAQRPSWKFSQGEAGDKLRDTRERPAELDRF